MISKMIFTLFFITLLSHSITNASEVDFCVANLSAAQTPSGYPCKPQSSVTADDFVFSKFVAGNSSNNFKASVAPATVHEFPAVNGLGISAIRVDFEVDGVFRMHNHRGASEIMMMVSGSITAGIIASDNSVYVKTVSKGEIMVFPQGLMHFQFNAGTNKAVAFLAFSSSDPGSQIVPVALFGNNLSTALVEKTTKLDPDQIKKLKVFFGGVGEQTKFDDTM